MAAAILETARDAGVPVHKDPELADALAGLALGAEVPEELWAAVAEALAWAYSVSDAARPSPGARVDDSGRRRITPNG